MIELKISISLLMRPKLIKGIDLTVDKGEV